ncbi:MAG: hypothetical protein R2748_19325 [Bryobacterales bacterium]
MRLALILPLFALAAQAQQHPVSFDRDVRPILSDACYAYHGPDEANRKAGLRLDQRPSAARVCFTPGDAAGTSSSSA